MRLKLSLKRQGFAVRDVQVTADATATIGDIGRYLVAADPDRPAVVDGQVTLRVEFPNSRLGDWPGKVPTVPDGLTVTSTASSAP